VAYRIIKAFDISGRRIKGVVILVALVMLLAIFWLLTMPCYARSANIVRARMVRIIDGDTFQVDIGGKKIQG